MSDFWAAVWFFLPAGLANSAPVFAAKFPGLKQFNTPLDLGKHYHGQRIFGANKTWRGLLAGIAISTVVIGLQKYLYAQTSWAPGISWFDYTPAVVWLLGPLFGIGVLLADAIESFFKRRRHIPPGDSWFPFDQTDYIIGGCVFSWPIVQLSLSQYLWILIVGFSLHLLTVYVGYALGVRDKPL